MRLQGKFLNLLTVVLHTYKPTNALSRLFLRKSEKMSKIHGAITVPGEVPSVTS